MWIGRQSMRGAQVGQLCRIGAPHGDGFGAQKAPQIFSPGDRGPCMPRVSSNCRFTRRSRRVHGGHGGTATTVSFRCSPAFLRHPRVLRVRAVYGTRGPRGSGVPTQKRPPRAYRSRRACLNIRPAAPYSPTGWPRQYHPRSGFSLPSSGWDRVDPPRHSHRPKWSGSGWISV